MRSNPFLPFFRLSFLPKNFFPSALECQVAAVSRTAREGIFRVHHPRQLTQRGPRTRY
jgi:hypothetical protein